MNILLIGSGAREHAIARAIKKSPQDANLFCFGSNSNPGIQPLSVGYMVGAVTDANAILSFAKENCIDFAIIGPEAPLEAGVADVLWEHGIPCVGPKRALAQIETSKSFARDLLTKHNIPACPKYKYFSGMVGVAEFLAELEDAYVVKADGLMGGKGVKVSGDHLKSHADALAWCKELIDARITFLIEEKLIGQEFSLMSFCDGTHLAHIPPIQDHKRAYVGDTGPNTGGMGSYSDANYLLPFLTPDDVRAAEMINEQTTQALADEFGDEYKGILYGGFMATKDGVRVIEYNARFGDPEAMNALAILESDFVALCQAIIDGNLTQDHARFASKATVCKYAVPLGYPDSPVKNERIDVSQVQDKDRLYFGSVEERNGELYETGSRTVAVVGVADTISEAEKIAEEEIACVKGPLFHREDIGTQRLIRTRVEMMDALRKIS
ncbi:MAG: phosphoribosylamine--glycine ligase [Candidatus Magasanikbacteria bacterium RIFCSPHIGHO2_02_FULL_51_14]|uniref:Phosphoribosylamine--glycine ligase n=1 Tax=Candidatus Magasanikbacteria bacterium RIFCSPHIGHO2_02_FULL_51_14 TaxID=1798683 RepID=A0A1F6MF83_9BACT|nr:MAG: phosphoribosylamine--glycine ligase [Candidatus Magasanikbacteria bacterium RIFCSPHIGHO2_02_FULL_51_14]